MAALTIRLIYLLSCFFYSGFFAPTIARSYEITDVVKRTLYMQNCSAQTSSEGCERSYFLYTPSSLRAEAEEGEGKVSVVPLVFAVHCLFCTSAHMMHFAKMAEAYSFVLAVPVGKQRSWNAEFCCGYALKQGIDDLGFFRSIIRELTVDMPFLSPDLVYALGWSNGGYMITYAAELFRAVAPISGHVYYGFESAVSGAHPVGLFMHHGANDDVVRITGCCMDLTKAPCCCKISTRSQRCVSANQFFQKWSRLVGCNGTESISLEDARRDIICHTSTGTSCRANTTFCVHKSGRHFRPSLALTFSMQNDIGDFFATDACETASHSGFWSSSSRTCSCTKEAIGAYCLGRVSANISSFVSSETTTRKYAGEKEGSGIVIGAGVGAFVLVAILLLMCASRLFHSTND